MEVIIRKTYQYVILKVYLVDTLGCHDINSIEIMFQTCGIHAKC